MHDLVLITKVLLKGHRSNKKWDLKRIALIAGGAVLGGVILLWLFLQMENLVVLVPADQSIQAGLALITLLNLVMSIFTFPPAFYFSNDTKRLVVLPVKPYAITGAKLIDNMRIQVLSGFLFALPMAAAFITTGVLGILQTLLFVFCAAILIPALILLAIGIVTMILARLLPWLMNEDRYTWLVLGATFIITIGFMLMNNANGGKMQLLQNAAQQDWFKGMQTVFFQNQLAAQAIADGNMVSLLLLAGMTAALVGVFMVTANAVYLPSVTRLQAKSTNNKKVKKTDIKSGSFLSNAVWTECKQIWRSPNYAASILPNALIIPLGIGATVVFSGDLGKVLTATRALDLSVLPLPAIAVMMGMTSLLFGMMTTTLSASAFSRKGTAGVRFMCQMPQKMETQLMAILIPSMVLSLIGPILLLIAINFMFNVPVWASLIFLAAAVLGCLLENLIALLLDLLNPSLVWDNEATASKNNINPYISYGINLLLFGAYGALFFFLVYPVLEAGAGLEIVNVFALASAAVVIVLCAVLYFYIMKTARRHLMEAL